MKNHKLFKRGLWILCIGFLLMNIVACFHAYTFTHFSIAAHHKTKDARQLSMAGKLKALTFGISNPRPENTRKPDRVFEDITIKNNLTTSAWMLRTDSIKRGTVVICHGYSGEKSSMLDKAYVFLELGYNTLLIDFMGSGRSEGSQTTIGFLEAEQVKDACQYVKESGETHILLFGTSMGAAAIMKAQKDYQFKDVSLILECPFGTMLKTVQSRFKAMHAPAFPMDRLLVFWGGTLNGFNAFRHNPQEYALQIRCPVLLLHGEQDEKVSMQEIHEIFQNLQGIKTLKTYPLAGHENYLGKYPEAWKKDIEQFIHTIPEK